MMDDLISREAAIKAIEEWDGACSEYPADQIINDTQRAIDCIDSVPAVPLDKLCECLVRKRIGFVDEVDGKRLTGELTKEAWATLIREWMEELDDGKEPV